VKHFARDQLIGTKIERTEGIGDGRMVGNARVAIEIDRNAGRNRREIQRR
jgi:hypothetical protein